MTMLPIVLTVTIIHTTHPLLTSFLNRNCFHLALNLDLFVIHVDDQEMHELEEFTFG